MDKLIQNRTFENARNTYTRYNGIYLLGTFVNTDVNDMNKQVIPLIPKESTHRLLNEQRSMAGYESLEEEIQKSPLQYTSNTKAVRKYLENIYNMNFAISAEGAEFLDSVGKAFPLHTLRLVEAVDQNYQIHYLLMTSPCVLEAKSDELVNAQLLEPQYNLFKNDHWNASKDNFIEFVLALIIDYFGKLILKNQVEYVSDISFLEGEYEEVNVTKQISLEGINNVTENIRFMLEIKTNIEYRP